jgi:hypothetical protein
MRSLDWTMLGIMDYAANGAEDRGEYGKGSREEQCGGKQMKTTHKDKTSASNSGHGGPIGSVR